MFKILVGILGAVLIVGRLVSCAAPESKEELAARALQYIEEKYDQEFTPVFYENPDILSTTRTIECITNGIDSEEERVHLYIRYDDEGNVVFSDDYFDFIVRPEIEEYISSMIPAVFGEHKVFANGPDVPLKFGFTKDNDLADVLEAYPDFRMSVHVYIRGSADVPYEEYERLGKEFEQNLFDTNNNYSLYFFVVNDEMYDATTRHDRVFWKEYHDFKNPDGDRLYYSYVEMIDHGTIWVNPYQ